METVKFDERTMYEKSKKERWNIMKNLLNMVIIFFILIISGCDSERLEIPTGLIINTVTMDSVTFSWNYVTYASGYQIYKSTSALGIYNQVVSDIKITGTKATITGLNAGYKYYFKVMAIGSRSYSNSDLSSYIEITTGKIPLATPTNLVSNEITINSINFSWNHVDNANSYHIYQNNSAYGTFIQVETNITITENNVTITGLNAGYKYYFKVMAIGSGEYSNSQLSNYITISTKPQLSTPTNLIKGKVTENSISFSWDNVSYAKSYEVYQSSDDIIYLKVISNITLTGCNATITGLNIYTTYYFKVIAIGDSSFANSEYSIYINAKTAPQLGTPTGLTLGSVANNSVSLSWNNVTNASSYDVYKSYNNNTLYVKEINVTGSNASITGLGAGNTYYFKVIAIGSEVYSNSDFSIEINAKTTGTKPKLTAPSGLYFTHINDNTVYRLSWYGVSNATSYSIYRSDEPSRYYSVYSNNVSGTSSGYIESSLYYTYYYKVAANGNEFYEGSDLSTSYATLARRWY